MSAIPFIRSLPAVAHASAQVAQKEVLDLALKQVGFIPNLYASRAYAPALLSTDLHRYALFRKESGLQPAGCIVALNFANWLIYIDV